MPAIPNVMLCERGIRTFETHTRFTLPLASVAYLHAKTHLPVVVDPSHGTGHTYLVPQMAAASVAAGADGLILEVHPDPENALSDGYQSLNFKQFAETMALCRKVAGRRGQKIRKDQAANLRRWRTTALRANVLRIVNRQDPARSLCTCRRNLHGRHTGGVRGALTRQSARKQSGVGNEQIAEKSTSSTVSLHGM